VDERRVLGGEVASSSGFLVAWSMAFIVVVCVSGGGGATVFCWVNMLGLGGMEMG
jgi:hypothetical protein